MGHHPRVATSGCSWGESSKPIDIVFFHPGHVLHVEEVTFMKI